MHASAYRSRGCLPIVGLNDLTGDDTDRSLAGGKAVSPAAAYIEKPAIRAKFDRRCVALHDREPVLPFSLWVEQCPASPARRRQAQFPRHGHRSDQAGELVGDAGRRLQRPRRPRSRLDQALTNPFAVAPVAFSGVGHYESSLSCRGAEKSTNSAGALKVRAADPPSNGSDGAAGLGNPPNGASDALSANGTGMRDRRTQGTLRLLPNWSRQCSPFGAKHIGHGLSSAP